MLDDKVLALLGDREAAERLTAAGVLLECPFCGARMEVRNGSAYGFYKTKCVFCGAESAQQGNEILARLRNNTRAPVLTPAQLALLRIGAEPRKFEEDHHDE